jgi:diguanylate cyclase (GGDEF)-like protein
VAGPSGSSERGLFSTLSRAGTPRDARQHIAAMEAVTTGSPTVLTIADQRFMTTPVDLQSAELFNAYLHIPMTDEASAFRQVGLQLSLLAGGAFLLVLVMSSWLSRRLTRPLGELGAAATKIGGGDYHVAIPQQSIREFSQLGDAFSAMQKAVDEREQAIFQQARRDDLTGLPNRLAAIECITRQIDNGKGGSPFALLSVDIHHLREINDSLGHETGDNLLRWLGSTLQANSLRDSTVCRIASDDFLVIMPRANATDAHAVAKQLFQATESSAQMDKDMKARIRINIGASLFPDHGQSAEALIRAAEQAMYKAKEQRSILQVYDASDDARRKRRLDLAYALRGAIANNEISLNLQPTIAFANPLGVYADALLRWESPAYGPIANDEFIFLAENSGQIAELNAWALEQTCALIANWQSRRIAVPVSINVSRHDLEDPGFVTRFIETTRKHGIEKSMLTLQISEDLAASSLEQSKEILSRLRRQRVRISIGHFGSGRSSLALLRDLAVDEIRIDRSFFRGNLKTLSEKAIVESIVQLAHQLGIQVVAEGVESKELLVVLKAMNVDGAQGYFLSRPLPPQQFETWRESWISSKRRNSQ